MVEPSFQIAMCECPDINANTMAIDSTGRYALISGRKSMVLIDLDGDDTNSNQSVPISDMRTVGQQQQQIVSSAATSQPKTSPISKKMVRNSKYEPTASQFSRHMIDLFALTTYQVAEIFSIEDLNPLKPKLTLRGHSRAITDVEWSHFDPYLLGTSAADCLTNLWDIRDNRRPSTTLISVSGATQVRFSRTSSNLLATSHEIDVRIWDIRQPNLPFYYIAAHLQKINGMDWNPNKTSCDHEQLVTCSQDNTIKLWDLNGSKIKPSANFPTRTPAWRVRYNPTSPNAILTSTLPQLRSRSECMALKLWSLKPSRYEQKKLELILGLVGHSDVIVDFDWRNRLSTSGCEIVSWSKDQTLRVWRIDQQFIEMNVDNSDFETECDVQDPNCDSIEPESLLYSNNTNELSQEQEKPLVNELKSPSSEIEAARIALQEGQPQVVAKSEPNPEGLSTINEQVSSSENELRMEFNLLNKKIPNIEFEELNLIRRVCLITARARATVCRLKIALPLGYPQTECPTFMILEPPPGSQYTGEPLTKEIKEKLLSILNETAKSQLSGSRNCLEPCLRKFIAGLQKISNSNSYRSSLSRRNISNMSGTSSQSYKDDPISLSAQRDHSIPFPSTCGARFCGNLLVCFGRPMIPMSIGSSSSSRNTTSSATTGSDSGFQPSTGGSSVSVASVTNKAPNWSVETPRSLAQLSAQLDNMRRQGQLNLNHISISYFYYGAMRRIELQNRSNKANSSSTSFSSRGNSKHPSSRTRSSLHSQSMMSKSYKCGPVLIYDVSDLLGGISRELAENYVFDKDVIKMCRRNAEIAAKSNRKDLVQIWSLAELSSEGVIHSYVPTRDNNDFSLIAQDSDFGDRPWTMHPFGSKLIQSLIDHYVNNCRDVQTAAMLVWTFSSPRLGINSIRNQSNKILTSSTAANKNNPLQYSITTANLNSSTGNNYTITKVSNSQIDAISGEWNFVNGPEPHLYSNSWSNTIMHEHLSDNQSQNNDQKRLDSVDACSGNHAFNTGPADNNSDKFPKLNILSPEKSLQNDLIMHIYADVLYRLNLLNQRAMVLKNVGSNSIYGELFGNRQTSNEVVEERLSNLAIQCNNVDCRKECKSTQCSNCKKYSLYCSICRLPVRGSSSICLKCFHGGHVNHFNTWFNSYDFCPTGCGCKCLNVDY